MKVLFTKAFLEQALYEMGSYTALEVNVFTDRVSIYPTIYSPKPIDSVEGFSISKITNSQDVKVKVFTSK